MNRRQFLALSSLTPNLLPHASAMTSQINSRDILTMPAPEADERISYGSDSLQFGELRLPAGDGPHPVAVVIHGGFWRTAYTLDHIGHLATALTEAGVATWSLEYRRIGDPGGGWPGTFEDIGAGADFVRQLAESASLDLARIVTVGHSAGGHLALWLAGRPRLPSGSVLAASDPLLLTGVVSLAGVADLRRAWELELSNTVVAELLGGAPAEVTERYRLASPIERLPLGLPQYLVHGTDDPIVPFEISERYTPRAQEEADDARLVRIEGAGHFELIDPRSGAWPSVSGAVLNILELK